jgi:hypothetical protein
MAYENKKLDIIIYLIEYGINYKNILINKLPLYQEILEYLYFKCEFEFLYVLLKNNNNLDFWKIKNKVNNIITNINLQSSNIPDMMMNNNLSNIPNIITNINIIPDMMTNDNLQSSSIIPNIEIIRILKNYEKNGVETPKYQATNVWKDLDW